MHKITRQTQANAASIRWKRQYPHDKNNVQARLDALGPIKDPDEVDRIIGNKSWTELPMCSECGKRSNEFVIEVGEEPDYESDTAWLCPACIRKLCRLTKGDAW